jgi:fructokinase
LVKSASSRNDVHMTFSALVIGEALVDIVAQPDGTTVEHPGGSPANVAVALSRLGASVELCTAYGDDRLGALLDQHFTDAGVALLGDPHSLAHTSSALATIDATGAASYAFDLEWVLSPPLLNHQPVLVHTGSLAAVMEPGAATVAEAIGRFAKEATISYDINARPAATGVNADLVARVDALVAMSDVVKASDEDLETLYPEASVEDSVQRILTLGAGAVIITWGGRGASSFSTAGRFDVKGERVEVADTIGAGDSFCAALLDGLRRREVLGSHRRAELRGLSLADWGAVMSRANRAAAITVSRAGANPPTAAELDTPTC